MLLDVALVLLRHVERVPGAHHAALRAHLGKELRVEIESVELAHAKGVEAWDRYPPARDREGKFARGQRREWGGVGSSPMTIEG